MPDQEMLKAILQRDMASIREAFSSLGGNVETDAYESWEEMLPGPDGAGLRTFFYRPLPLESPVPVIVQRGCYPMEPEKAKLLGPGLASLGFGYIFQCCRGTMGSEGIWEPNIHERADGKSLLEHLETLPWIASMGLYGRSYLALTWLVVADILPSKVRSMHLAVYGTERFTSAYQDGLFRQDILTSWAMHNAGHPVEASYIDSAKYRPQISVDTDLWGGKLDWYRDWITHPDGDDPYWTEGFWGMLQGIPEKLPEIPIYIGEGWYDHHLGSTLQGLSKVNGQARTNLVVRIGPWNHGNQVALDQYPHQKNAAENETGNWVTWFIRTLQNHEIPDGQVQYYSIGDDRWHTAAHYPFPPGRSAVLYLQGHELEIAPGRSGQRDYDYDPDTPVVTWGAESLLESGEISGGVRTQPPPDWRKDILSFVSAPLEKTLDILGPIHVKLFVQSTAADTCFTIKLMEVLPDGTAYHIRNGATTLGYRNHAPHRIGYNGDVVEINIETWDIAWQLRAGSRLRIDISSSNFPEYAIHTNQAVAWAEAKDAVIARQTVCYGNGMESCVILPLAESADTNL